MVHLLDINVLIALFDPGHVHHSVAHNWFAGARASGWATCPTTENGLVRVLANPAYPGRRTTVADAASRLGQFCASGHHTFWPALISLLDADRIRPELLGGHRAVSDAYLLGVAVAEGGALATFDRGVRVEAVPDFEAANLVVLRTEG